MARHHRARPGGRRAIARSSHACSPTSSSTAAHPTPRGRRRGARRPVDRRRRHGPAGGCVRRTALHGPEGRHGHPARPARRRRSIVCRPCRSSGSTPRITTGKRFGPRTTLDRGLQRRRCDVAGPCRRGIASCRLARARRRASSRRWSHSPRRCRRRSSVGDLSRRSAATTVLARRSAARSRAGSTSCSDDMASSSSTRPTRA